MRQTHAPNSRGDKTRGWDEPGGKASLKASAVKDVKRRNRETRQTRAPNSRGDKTRDRDKPSGKTRGPNARFFRAPRRQKFRPFDGNGRNFFACTGYGRYHTMGSLPTLCR